MGEIRERDIQAIRRFTRFYTRQIELLSEGILASPYSLSEARVLYELATRDAPTASDLVRDLGLDAGYLSRILKRFEEQGLVSRAGFETDRRRARLALTERGRAAFEPLDRASQEQVAGLLRKFAEPERRRLVAAMGDIERLAAGHSAGERAFTLRPHRVGDMGWITHRQGVLYAEEYGWDERFEALVAEIVAAFIKGYDPTGERCWIAERNGEVVGSVFCVRESAEVAKLRLLYVEPSARGFGLGRRLVAECIAFAREAGYRRLTLWTNDILVSAREIYVKAGFRLVEEEHHRSFGHDLVGQNWDLAL